MPKPIKTASNGRRHYLTYTAEDGSETSLALSPHLDQLTPESKQAILDAFVVAYREGKARGASRRGRPRKRASAAICPNCQGPSIPPAPKWATPQQLADAAVASLEDDLAHELIAERTVKIRKSEINRMLEELGGSRWDKWVGRRGWGYWMTAVRAFEKTTRTGYRASAHKMIAAGQDAGLKTRDFVAEAPLPKMTPALKAKMKANAPRPRGKKRIYSEAELGRIAGEIDRLQDRYDRLVLTVIEYQGMSGADAHQVLAGRVGIDWDRREYTFSRTKTSEPRVVPLAQPVIDALLPFHSGNGVSVPSPKVARAWDKNRSPLGHVFNAIEERAYVDGVVGHRAKRLRHTFRIMMRRHCKLERTEIDHLMAWKYEDKQGDTGSFYEEADPDEMRRGIDCYAQLLDRLKEAKVSETDEE